MTRDSEPHPDTDTRGDTIEFAAIEQEAPEFVCYEIGSGVGVRLTHLLEKPVEIRIGQTTETSPLFLHEGSDFPDLCEATDTTPALARVLVQPEVMCANPNNGWLVIDGWTSVGRAETPQFRLGGDISRKEHISLGPTADGHFEIVGVSPNPTMVFVERKFGLSNYELNH